MPACTPPLPEAPRGEPRIWNRLHCRRQGLPGRTPEPVALCMKCCGAWLRMPAKLGENLPFLYKR